MCNCIVLLQVSREDKLPQKICDGCSYKLDVVYDFRNTTVNAEKQLLTWLSEAQQGSATAAAARQVEQEVSQQIKPSETFVKQEAIDPSDVSKEEDDVKSYMFHDKYEEVCAILFYKSLDDGCFSKSLTFRILHY